ncbi:MAG: hypothetical protein IPL11_06690 [Candidatus Accumulibacter sp.]|nr:hypothetical protein [Accumulibacter sp.]
MVKKAYCDWERYKGFRPPCTRRLRVDRDTASATIGQELRIIRLVVDARICAHQVTVDTFVIISGDLGFFTSGFQAAAENAGT